MYFQSSIWPATGINLSSVVNQVAHSKLSYSSSQGFIWYCSHSWCINLVALCILLRVWHFPPNIGDTSICRSFVLLVNNFYYWLAGSKNKRYVVKPPLLYKINESAMKTLVLFVKEILLHHKTLSRPVFS